LVLLLFISQICHFTAIYQLLVILVDNKKRIPLTSTVSVYRHTRANVPQWWWKYWPTRFLLHILEASIATFQELFNIAFAMWVGGGGW